MPRMYETHLKWVLITCAGLLASSLGVFISVLSVIISPLLSPFSTPPKPVLIGEGKVGIASRLQYPPERIRPRFTRRPSFDKSSSLSSNTFSSNSTIYSTHSNVTTSNEGQRSTSSNGTKINDDIYNTSESPASLQPSTPGSTSTSSSPPKPQKNGLRTYLGMRKRSTILDEPTPEEPSPMTGNAEIDPDKASREPKLDQAEIIVSPPTPSSTAFPRSAPGPSETRFAGVSTGCKPAARFIKSHAKRHSLTATCSRKRRSGKRSPNAPTPKSASPTPSPVIESKWHIATRASHRKKRKSLRIDPPLRSATPPMLIENEDTLGYEIIYEEPISIRPRTAQLPLTPARPGPVRTRPYEAPYFFPTPGSPEAIGYVEKVREERRLAPINPDPVPSRNKKDLKRRSSTISSLENDGTPSSTKLRGEGSQDQTTEGSGKKQQKSTGKRSGAKSTNASPSPANEFGVQVRTPAIHRKASAPAQLSSLDTLSMPAAQPRSQPQRQGSLAIMRILGKH